MRPLLFFFFVLVACGRHEYEKRTDLNSIRSYVPVVLGFDEQEKMAQICTALESKANTYRIPGTEVFTFGVSGKACKEVSSGPESLVNTKLVVESEKYLLKRADDGSDFIYPNFETNSSGVMKDICQNLKTITSPGKLVNGEAIWFRSHNVGTIDCNPKSNEVCLLIETGSPSFDGREFKIHTQEWIKFQVSSSLPRYGFFVERKTKTTRSCDKDEFLQYQANLK